MLAYLNFLFISDTKGAVTAYEIQRLYFKRRGIQCINVVTLYTLHTGHAKYRACKINEKIIIILIKFNKGAKIVFFFYAVYRCLNAIKDSSSSLLYTSSHNFTLHEIDSWHKL